VIVEIFLDWLYTGHYPENDRFEQLTSDGNPKWSNQLLRVKACEFGNRFQANEFMLISEIALVDYFVVGEGVSWYQVTIYAFDRLPPTSLVLQLLIDIQLCCWSPDHDTEENGELELRSNLPHAFLLGVMCHSRRERWTLDRCDYHRHGSDAERGTNCQIPFIDNFDV
jgi:hypothetical protein